MENLILIVRKCEFMSHRYVNKEDSNLDTRRDYIGYSAVDCRKVNIFSADPDLVKRKKAPE